MGSSCWTPEVREGRHDPPRDHDSQRGLRRCQSAPLRVLDVVLQGAHGPGLREELHLEACHLYRGGPQLRIHESCLTNTPTAICDSCFIGGVISQTLGSFWSLIQNLVLTKLLRIPLTTAFSAYQWRDLRVVRRAVRWTGRQADAASRIAFCQ